MPGCPADWWGCSRVAVSARAWPTTWSVSSWPASGGAGASSSDEGGRNNVGGYVGKAQYFGPSNLRTPRGNWAGIKARWWLRRWSGWVISVEHVLSSIALPKHDEPVGVADPHVPHHGVGAVISGLRQRLPGAPVTRAVGVARVGRRVGWAAGLTKGEGTAGATLGRSHPPDRRNRAPQPHGGREAGDQSLHDLGLFLDPACASIRRFVGQRATTRAAVVTTRRTMAQ